MATSSGMDTRSSQIGPSPTKSSRTAQGTILAATPTADREMNEMNGMFVDAASTHGRESVAADDEEEALGSIERLRQVQELAALADAAPVQPTGASSSGSAVQNASAIMAMLDRESANSGSGEAAVVASVTRVAGEPGGRVLIERHEVKLPEQRSPDGPFTGDEVRGLIHATVYEAEARHRAKLDEILRLAAESARAETAEAYIKITAGAKEEAQAHVQAGMDHMRVAAEELYQQMLNVTQERDVARHQAEVLVGGLTRERDEARQIAEEIKEQFIKAASDAKNREQGWTEAAAASRSRIAELESAMSGLMRAKEDLRVSNTYVGAQNSELRIQNERQEAEIVALKASRNEGSLSETKRDEIRRAIAELIKENRYLAEQMTAWKAKAEMVAVSKIPVGSGTESPSRGEASGSLAVGPEAEPRRTAAGAMFASSPMPSGGSVFGGAPPRTAAVLPIPVSATNVVSKGASQGNPAVFDPWAGYFQVPPQPPSAGDGRTHSLTPASFGGTPGGNGGSNGGGGAGGPPGGTPGGGGPGGGPGSGSGPNGGGGPGGPPGGPPNGGGPGWFPGGNGPPGGPGGNPGGPGPGHTPPPPPPPGLPAADYKDPFGRPKPREGEKVLVKQLPDQGKLRAWKESLRDEVMATSNVGAPAFEWILEVEHPGSSMASLANSGHFPSLDSKLKASLMRVVSGSLQMKIANDSEKAIRSGKFLTGRQVLWMIYDHYRVDEEAADLHDVLDLSEVTCHGDQDIERWYLKWGLVLQQQRTEQPEKNLRSMFLKQMERAPALRPDITEYYRMRPGDQNRSYAWLEEQVRRHLAVRRYRSNRDAYAKSIRGSAPSAAASSEPTAAPGTMNKKGRGRSPTKSRSSSRARSGSSRKSSPSSGNSGRSTSGKKGNPCWEFMATGKCARGKRCRHAHDRSSMKSRDRSSSGSRSPSGRKRSPGRRHARSASPAATNDGICRRHQKGLCAFGDRCKFKHEGPPGNGGRTRKSQSKPSVPANRRKESEDEDASAGEDDTLPAYAAELLSDEAKGGICAAPGASWLGHSDDEDDEVQFSALFR